ncbi:MAG: hypothetical protein NTW14_07795 [bacterium]|nr:hypothetical protein [bacterium]
MKRIALILLILTPLSGIHAQYFERGPWESRLALTGTVGIWSPKGDDATVFGVSLGGGLSLNYWYNPRTQVILGINYSSLKTQQEYFRGLVDTLTFDVWDVQGRLFSTQLEFRQLFSADNLNYLYLGAGGELVFFGDIVGNYEIYGTQQPIKGTIRTKRDPNFAGGLFVDPGMFFLFYKKVFVDVGVRVHWLYDGKRSTYWLQPAFSAGWRLK